MSFSLFYQIFACPLDSATRVDYVSQFISVFVLHLNIESVQFHSSISRKRTSKHRLGTNVHQCNTATLRLSSCAVEARLRFESAVLGGALGPLNFNHRSNSRERSRFLRSQTTRKRMTLRNVRSIVLWAVLRVSIMCRNSFLYSFCI